MATLAELKMNKAALPLPTYPRHDLLLSPDPTMVEELSVMQAEFDFRYATGETSDYDGFRERWLAAGGQQLLDEAEAQLRNFGLIKKTPEELAVRRSEACAGCAARSRACLPSIRSGGVVPDLVVVDEWTETAERQEGHPGAEGAADRGTITAYPESAHAAMYPIDRDPCPIAALPIGRIDS